MFKPFPELRTKSILALFLEKFVKIHDSARLNYPPASGRRKQDFFSIEFYWRPEYTLPLKRYRKTFNLNRIPDIKERKAAAEVMASTVTEALKDGRNPEENEVSTSNARTLAGKINASILQAVQTALKSKLLKVPKERSRQSYRSNTNHFIEWLKKEKINKLLNYQD